MASSGSSMTNTLKPARWSLRTALPGESATTETSYRSRSIRVTSEYRCSWAPPFVPVARTSTTRMRRAPGTTGRSTGLRQRSQGCGGVTSGVAAADENALDRLVDGAPLVLVRLVATQEVEARDAALESLA